MYMIKRKNIAHINFKTHIKLINKPYLDIEI